MSSLQTALSIIKQTNALLAKRFQTLGLDAVRLKKNEEIVTEADMAANRLITGRLLKAFPGDDIVSEEAKKIDNPGKNTWYIDPLDGSTNFSYGLRDFATCLAKITPQKIELGVIGIPLAREIYWAEAGGAAYLNNQKIRISSTFNHGSRYLLLLCGGHTRKSQSKFLNVIKKLDVDTVRFRVISSAGIELSSVACGRADGCIITDAHPWDFLAGVLLVRAAGGKVTNFHGDNWTIKDTNLIASNGLIHGKLLNLVK